MVGTGWEKSWVEREMKTSTNRKLNHFFYGKKRRLCKLLIVSCPAHTNCGGRAANGRKHNWYRNSGSHFAVFWTLNFNKIIIIYTRSSPVEWRRSDRACRKLLCLQSPQKWISFFSVCCRIGKKKTFLRNSRCKLFDCFLRFAHSSRSSFVAVLGGDLGVKVKLYATQTAADSFSDWNVNHTSLVTTCWFSIGRLFLSSSNYYSRYRKRMWKNVREGVKKIDRRAWK